MEKHEPPISKEDMVTFHKDLCDLLDKYNLRGDDDRILVKTSKVNLFATRLSNCSEGCTQYGPHQDPATGQIVVGWYCAC